MTASAARPRGPLAALDLRCRPARPERPRRPPAPLDAVLAHRSVVVPVDVHLAELPHLLAVPGGEDTAVLHVPERRLRVVVALARDERAVPEDVAVVPE